MADDRRSYAAVALRKFFDEQIDHMQNLAESLLAAGLGVHAHKDPEHQILERFVDEANNRMRAVSGYQHKLRPHVQALHSHVQDVVAKIPAPVWMQAGQFADNPLINALFTDSSEIDKLFGSDPEIGKFLQGHDKYRAPVVYALMSVAMTEKHGFGFSIMGDVLVSDVPQTAVNFSAHRIHAPCADSATLSHALADYLFDRIVLLLKQEMAERMASDQALIHKVSYEARVHSLENPEVYLETLVQSLTEPNALLTIEKIALRLSKLGIKMEGREAEPANEFELCQLLWRGQSGEVILQVAYPW